ncbi:translation initiation factor IF-3 [Candidatus Falkowbacteria bacterium]|nr:translation initiation factor IF-3 [Candidatus Falkowbacteria bacterium]
MRRKWRKAKPKVETKKFIANRDIRVPEVFLIGDEGEQIGATPTFKAIEMAKDLDMDLVLVNPKADPPVAKISDLGQLKYEADKKAHKQKMQQKKTDTKEIRLSVRISQHDFDMRIEQGKKFLSKENKLKIYLILKGRERQHPKKGAEVIERFVSELKKDESLNIVEEQPLTKQGGRFIIVIMNKK